MSDFPPETPPPEPTPSSPDLPHTYQSAAVQQYGSPDLSSLDTLSIFYYILAALGVLAGFVPLLYMGCGTAFGLLGAAGSSRPEEAGAAAGVSAFFICVGLPFLAILWTLAFLNYLTAKSLRERKRLTLCFAMAIIACLNFPLGTILGVFTLVVLNKPEVKQRFT